MKNRVITRAAVTRDGTIVIRYRGCKTPQVMTCTSARQAWKHLWSRGFQCTACTPHLHVGGREVVVVAERAER